MWRNHTLQFRFPRIKSTARMPQQERAESLHWERRRIRCVAYKKIKFRALRGDGSLHYHGALARSF